MARPAEGARRSRHHLTKSSNDPVGKPDVIARPVFDKGAGTGDVERLLSSLGGIAGPQNDQGEARGRPVGVALDKTGALLIADDVGNTVWRVSADTQASAAEPGQTAPKSP